MTIFAGKGLRNMINGINLPRIPITSNILASMLDGYKAPMNKISEMEKHGEIVRLKKGLYLAANAVDEKSIIMAANHIYGPSYVSCETALRFYGLIPEHVFTTTSVTTSRKRTFENKLGRFSYDYLPLEYYKLGIQLIVDENISFQIASPEKALADYIVLASGLRLRYVKETLEWLENDLRIDMDIFREMNPTMFEEFAQVCRKPQAMINLVKILRQ